MQQCESSPDAVGCVLPAEFDIRTCAAERDRLQPFLDVPGSLALDGGAVARIDTSALQLLVAFTRDLRAAGTSVQWTAVSPALAHAAGALGVTALLDLPDAADVPSTSCGE